jgi:hypothetical protein
MGRPAMSTFDSFSPGSAHGNREGDLFSSLPKPWEQRTGNYDFRLNPGLRASLFYLSQFSDRRSGTLEKSLSFCVSRTASFAIVIAAIFRS